MQKQLLHKYNHLHKFAVIAIIYNSILKFQAIGYGKPYADTGIAAGDPPCVAGHSLLGQEISTFMLMISCHGISGSCGTI